MHLLLLPLLLLAIDADTFTGKVITVKDGDSIVVLRDKEQVEIRLLDIDCPELDQAFGRQAKKQTSDLCLGKTVTNTRRRQVHRAIPNCRQLSFSQSEEASGDGLDPR